jgi:thioredoxin-related protein
MNGIWMRTNLCASVIALAGLVLPVGCSKEPSPSDPSSGESAPATAATATSAKKTNEAELWIEDMPKARQLARELNKPMLLDFTGSDWCGWCIRLEREVFSQAEFQDYARKNLIAVKLDFPRRKQQSDALKKQNQTLAEEFGIEGFPTLIVLSPDGKRLGALGYMPGGPTAFLAKLKQIIGK